MEEIGKNEEVFIFNLFIHFFCGSPPRGSKQVFIGEPASHFLSVKYDSKEET